MSCTRQRLYATVLLLFAVRAGAVTQVSNLTESYDAGFTSQGTYAHASTFTTGATSTQLQSITVAVSSNSAGTAELRLRADNAGSPGTMIASLGSQTVPAAGLAHLIFNAGGTPTLFANTTYWVTLGETGSGDLQWDGTISTAQTSPSGWTIGDQTKYSSNGGASWVDVSFGPPNESGRFAVDATAIIAAPPALAVGDLLFQAIFAVDGTTGNRSILSGCADGPCSTQVGTGPVFEGVYSLALDVDNSLLVVDGLGDSVMDVDPANGNRTVRTGCADAPCSSVVGAGINLAEPVDVRAIGGSQLLLTDFGARALLLVDGAGNRTTLSGCADNACSSILGSGRNFVGPGGLLRKLPSGEIYVADRPPFMTSGPKAVMKIDPGTGDRTIVSGCIDAACTSIAGTGPSLSRPMAGFVQADGSLIVCEGDLSAVIRIDPITGNRTIVSGPSVGSGPAFSGGPFGGPAWVARAADGSLLVTDIGLASLFRVDPVTGNRTVVSSSSVGSGPNFEATTGLTLPEPGALAGLVSCAACLALLARWRRI